MICIHVNLLNTDMNLLSGPILAPGEHLSQPDAQIERCKFSQVPHMHILDSECQPWSMLTLEWLFGRQLVGWLDHMASANDTLLTMLYFTCLWENKSLQIIEFQNVPNYLALTKVIIEAEHSCQLPADPTLLISSLSQRFQIIDSVRQWQLSPWSMKGCSGRRWLLLGWAELTFNSPNSSVKHSFWGTDTP